MHFEKQGLHILSTLELNDSPWLTNCQGWLEIISHMISKHGLNEVGKTHYEFPNQSYTAAVCLKESHICIHTWPEYKRIYLDIYVCNLLTDNRTKAIQVYEEIIQLFDAKVIHESKIER